MALTKLQREFIEHLIIKEDTGLTDDQWRKLAGLSSPTTVHNWKRNPDFIKALEKRKADYELSSPFARKTRLWVLEEAIVNYDKASKDKDSAEKRHWWKILASLTEDDHADKRIDYEEYSDDELWALLCERGLDEEAAKIEAAKARLKKGGK